MKVLLSVATSLLLNHSAHGFSVVRNTPLRHERPAMNLEMSRASEDMSSSATTTRRNTLLQLPFLASALVLPTAGHAREPIPTYLEEPTEEFKESERQRMEFRRKQLALKAEFNVVFERFTNQSKTEEELRADVEQLRDLVIKTGGMPLGIKKDDLVKIIRAKKAKGFWPTSVEISYQALIREIAFQQSPNTDKDYGNPMDQR
mmetsp:Transcript_5786/g.7269  ORF Transcript_5786/g.7269 Transcript_5786/m.7269 type:complete len:203 (-) Transcript_5786:260-868(-)|eukprot:CAMPEP_0172489066 /NCGR_PEP_ID=MMETSP1066-20121228/18834_1 /TAXON_ID=671091 /ORGANISM="Coscinodiscus wailesii, Strain CCMP2513" /LENGTH=202 /DNA_ID=CAMNT_0013256665 /DNA_START=28 /DNA_END=636 /DNA_ORIENTATION=-